MNKTGKYVSIFMWVLIAITAILAISFIANISDNKADPAMNSWLSTNLVWSYNGVTLQQNGNKLVRNLLLVEIFFEGI